MIIHYAVASVQGSTHEINTDHFLLCLGPKTVLKGGTEKQTGELKQCGAFFALGNGVHDGQTGSECSESAMGEFQTLLEGLEDHQVFRVPDAKNLLDEGMRRVHELLLQLTETRDDGVQMMASAASMWFCQDYAVYSQVGNARIYRFAERVLELLTEDNTEAWELVKEGKATPDKLQKYPGHRVLTQVLGGKGKQKPVIDIKSLRIENHDAFLLCTSGLTDGVSDQEMEEMLLSATDSDGAVDTGVAERILEFSSKAHGKNNATVILCQVFPEQSLWTDMIRNLG